jgi:hypothetical protein
LTFLFSFFAQSVVSMVAVGVFQASFLMGQSVVDGSEACIGGCVFTRLAALSIAPEGFLFMASLNVRTIELRSNGCCGEGVLSLTLDWEERSGIDRVSIW